MLLTSCSPPVVLHVWYGLFNTSSTNKANCFEACLAAREQYTFMRLPARAGAHRTFTKLSAVSMMVENNTF